MAPDGRSRPLQASDESKVFVLRNWRCGICHSVIWATVRPVLALHEPSKKKPRPQPGVSRFPMAQEPYFFAFFFFGLLHQLADLVYFEHEVIVPLAGRPTSLAAASAVSRVLA